MTRRNKFIRGQCAFFLFLIMLFSVGCVGTEASSNIAIAADKSDTGRYETDRYFDSLKFCAKAVPDKEPVTAKRHTNDTAEKVSVVNPSEGQLSNERGEQEPIIPVEPGQGTEIHTHHYSVYKEVPAGCTSDGYITYKCDCGSSYNDNIVYASGHSWGEWITITEATTSSEGQQKRTCSVCGSSETQIIEILSDPEVSLDYAAAEAYGNSYAASTYGFSVNGSLNSGNAGYYPASTTDIYACSERGGQAYLNSKVASKVDTLYSNLSSYGSIEGCAVNCDVYDNGSGVIFIVVYYG